MLLQCCLYDATLDSLPAPVNESHLAQPGLVGRDYILFDDGLDVAGSEGMKVDFAVDRDVMLVARHVVNYGLS